ncbi:hypothetical protein SEA_LILMARTIN_179 [Streptomyces phage LilMartin]|nr:hypothetical protein SEA_LILMARTIN_179 [Streptomyces phage LilMartin]QNO12570.1 hypothetical protein SEA_MULCHMANSION_180 [Streptomyces phage MulchMansion]UVK61240.1 hypothetical protein SEA_ANGELA_181 [Streptomyces phage Angela]
MAFIREHDPKKPWKVWKFCDACRAFKTKVYNDDARGLIKMDQEADKHYKNCSAVR